MKILTRQDILSNFRSKKEGNAGENVNKTGKNVKLDTLPKSNDMQNNGNILMAVMLSIAYFTTACNNPASSGQQLSSTWQKEFGLSERNLGPTGRNQFFILEPGFQLILESATEKLAVTVLDETKEITGIVTRVVEEREWRNGELIEISRNFFAICEKTKDVFYFGEDVDMYKGGEVTNHQGAWLAGVNGATAGLIMPGKPVLGMKYYQEMAKGVAMDRAIVVKLDDALETPAGNFTNCLLTKESTAINPFELEFKTYAPGIGLIQDQQLLLTSHGFIEKK